MGAVLVAIGCFYFWAPDSFHEHAIADKPEGFYNELADAFRAGQVSLQRQPDPRLIALKDPYDPSANAAFRVNDLSYFRGRYFIYMGPAPALTLFLPFRVLTGRYLKEKTGASLLCVIGAFSSVCLLLHIRRAFLPDSPTSVLACSILALIVADGYYVAARGTIAQQVTISGGYAFGMLSLLLCGLAVTSVRNARLLFMIASLCMGLAIASRPNYVFASLALIPPFIFWVRGQSPLDFGGFWKMAACAAIPLGSVVALFLAYNYARFGHIFEFGQRYQLGGWNQLKLSSSGLGHGWENAWRYLLAPARYSAYFPFVAAPTWIAVSILPHVPWLWLLPVGVYSVFRKDTPSAIRALGFSSLILGGTNLLTLVFLPSGNPEAVLTSANARYLLDFQPALTLFVALGVVAVFQPNGLGSRIKNSIWIFVVFSLCAASAVVALSLDIGNYPSPSYRSLAYILNLPVYAWEKLRGTKYGPLDMDIVFPPNHIGAFEPLVSTGTETSADLVYVNYVSPTQVRFGFVSTGLQGPIGAPVDVDYGKSVHVKVSMGSLYPPDGYPLWLGFTAPQMSYLRRHLDIDLNGRRVLDVQAYFSPSPKDALNVGGNRYLTGYASAAFSGTILSSRRGEVTAPPAKGLKGAVFGAVHLVLALPEQRREGVKEPLVTTGVPRAGDIVYVEYLSGSRVSIGVDHWGGAGFRTAPLPVDFAVKHTVTISIGSLYPIAAHSGLVQHARVELDGAPVFDGGQDTYDSLPEDVAVGTNPIGGSTCSYAFTGQILQESREPEGK